MKRELRQTIKTLSDQLSEASEKDIPIEARIKLSALLNDLLDQKKEDKHQGVLDQIKNVAGEFEISHPEISTVIKSLGNMGL